MPANVIGGCHLTGVEAEPLSEAELDEQDAQEIQYRCVERPALLRHSICTTILKPHTAGLPLMTETDLCFAPHPHRITILQNEIAAMSPDLGAIERYRAKDADYSERVKELLAVTSERDQVCLVHHSVLPPAPPLTCPLGNTCQCVICTSSQPWKSLEWCNLHEAAGPMNAFCSVVSPHAAVMC